MRNEGLSSVMPFTNRGLVDKVIRDEAIVYDVLALDSAGWRRQR